MTDNGFTMLISTILKGKAALWVCTINLRTTNDEIRQKIHKHAHLGIAKDPMFGIQLRGALSLSIAWRLGTGANGL